MKYFRFAKLVRDKIPGHMASDNQVLFGVRKLEAPESVKELCKKVLEETRELADAENIESMKGEIADVQEVLDCLKKELKLEDKELSRYRERKISKNGGFDDMIYVEYIGCEDDSKWTGYYLKNQDRYPQINMPEDQD